MDQQEVRVREILLDVLTVKPEDITREASLAEDLGASSLDLIDIMTEMENGFRIEITEEQAAELLTLQNILDFLRQAPGAVERGG